MTSIWNMNDPILILFRPFVCLDWCICYVWLLFLCVSSLLHKIGIWYSCCCRSFGSHALLTWTLCSNISSYISFLPLHLIWFISDFNLFRFARKHVIRHFEMQLINQVIAFNVDAVCTFCIDQQPQQQHNVKEATNFVVSRGDLCRRVFVIIIMNCGYGKYWELMSYRQHSSISSHNRKCAIRRHFEIYVRCGLHSIPSIACMSCIYCILNRVWNGRASACCMEICYLWPHLSDQHISTAWQTPPFSTQRDEKQPHIAYETILLCVCSMCSLARCVQWTKSKNGKKRTEDWFSWQPRREHGGHRGEDEVRIKMEKNIYTYTIHLIASAEKFIWETKE